MSAVDDTQVLEEDVQEEAKNTAVVNLVPQELQVVDALEAFGNGLQVPEETGDPIYDAHHTKCFYAGLRLVEVLINQDEIDPISAVSSLSNLAQQDMDQVHAYAVKIAESYQNALKPNKKPTVKTIT